MSGAERMYGLLLRAYPPSFRAAYGREMLQLFRDQLRDRRRGRGGPGAAFWAAALWDVMRSAPALRMEALRAGWRARSAGPSDGGPHFQPEGGPMTARRTVAVLAIIGGVLELLNTGTEAWAANRVTTDGSWVFAIVLGFAVGVLLLSSGSAALRRGPAAARTARVTAIACLALVAGIQIVFPFMSIFARILGFGLPIALLAVAGRRDGTAGREPGAPAVA